MPRRSRWTWGARSSAACSIASRTTLPPATSSSPATVSRVTSAAASRSTVRRSPMAPSYPRAPAVRTRAGSLRREMRVQVRLFAMLRERAGRDVLDLELPDGARVAVALAAVDAPAGGLPLVLAVNREYAPPDQALAPGHQIAP